MVNSNSNSKSKSEHKHNHGTVKSSHHREQRPPKRGQARVHLADEPSAEVADDGVQEEENRHAGARKLLRKLHLFSLGYG